MLSLISNSFLIFLLALWPFSFSKEKAPLKKSALELPQRADQFETIRIFLMQGVSEIRLETSSSYTLTDHEGHVLMKGDRIPSSRLIPNGTGMMLGVQNFQDQNITLESRGGAIQVGKNRYRHKIHILLDPNGKLSLINELPLEEYLKGVLPGEMVAKWSEEALKAQAIVSRTYALFNMILNQHESFDLSDDVMSQVYKGRVMEHPATNRAVELTRGQILTYHGKIFPAYFHSTCGGHTAKADTLWDIEPNSVLKGVPCTFCRSSKHYSWKAVLTIEAIEHNLERAGFPVAGLQRISLTDFDSGGRAGAVWIEDSAGKRKLRANDFRLWVGPEKIRSTMLAPLIQKGKEFHFRGHGWGHGAGLCQYGTKYLAGLGYTYRQVLQYYYPGSEIKQFWPRPDEGSAVDKVRSKIAEVFE